MPCFSIQAKKEKSIQIIGLVMKIDYGNFYLLNDYAAHF